MSMKSPSPVAQPPAPRGGLERLLKGAAEWLAARMGRHSPLGDQAFFPDSSFPWVRMLEDNWQEIREELDQLLLHRQHLPNLHDISARQSTLSDDENWKTYFFVGYGLKPEVNRARCPRTTQLLDQIPGLTTAFFSILGPGKRLPEHCGSYRGIIRYHLALKIPSPSTASGIRVGGQTAHWEEGKSLIFDDTYPHEAWNSTDEDRVVLFLDIIRPLSFPYSLLNRMVLKSIAWTASARDAKVMHNAWEKWFANLHNSTQG